ncbi:MAG: DUF3298 domain-containing protein [Acidobacteria bacterium]|nr:DUF3298 domain-containing protein [Acidobacteriota bacterium]
MTPRTLPLRCLLVVAGLAGLTATVPAGKPKPVPLSVTGTAWEGTLGKNRIQARLTLDAPSPSGWYWTEIEPAGEETAPGTSCGEPVKLTVKKADGELVMTESDAQGNPTGIFTGTRGEKGVISGNWSREAGGRKVPFVLRPLENAPPHFTLKSAVIEDHQDRRALYDLKVEVPRMSCPTRPAMEREFNEQVETLASAGLDGVRTAFEEAYAAIRQYDSHKNLTSVGTRSQYLVSYRIAYTSPRHVALHFTVFRYEMGAAHPQTNSLTLNFDLASLAPVALPDLFTPGSPWLKTLSAFCREDLLGTLEDADEGWVKEGTSLDEDNFKRFLVLGDGLLILFDAYQVACHAAGAQEVKVPYTAFKGALRADFKP